MTLIADGALALNSALANRGHYLREQDVLDVMTEVLAAIDTASATVVLDALTDAHLTAAAYRLAPTVDVWAPVERPQSPRRLNTAARYMSTGNFVWDTESRSFGQVASHRIESSTGDVLLRWAARPDAEVRMSAGSIWQVAIDPVMASNWNDDIADGVIDPARSIDPEDESEWDELQYSGIDLGGRSFDPTEGPF